jgi:hypothetical protein
MFNKRIFSQPIKHKDMSVTKANQLSEHQYLHLLDVAKSLRGAYLRLSKDNCYRVYTEARKDGLRSKMCMGKVNVEAMAKLNGVVEALYPHLNIVFKTTDKTHPWSYGGVSIFIKVK